MQAKAVESGGLVELLAVPCFYRFTNVFVPRLLFKNLVNVASLESLQHLVVVPHKGKHMPLELSAVVPNHGHEPLRATKRGEVSL